MGVKYPRHGESIYRTPQWAALRVLAKRRDRFRCCGCGAAGRLEVDHVQPMRSHPELALELSNLQSLCPACHTRKTRVECGHPELNPDRLAWRKLVHSTETNRK